MTTGLTKTTKGIQVKHFKQSNNDLGSIYIVYESPVRNEDEALKGTSHLLEHMICGSLDDIEETFDEHCLSYNAYTDQEEVVFYLSGLSSELAKFRELFIERITSYKPTLEHYQREKPIVLQEYDDAYSDSYFSAVSNYMSAKHGHIGPIGIRSSIENTSFEQISELHSRVFQAPSKVIIIDKTDMDVRVPFADTSTLEVFPVKYVNGDAPSVPSSIHVVNASPIIPVSGSYHLPIIKSMLGYGLKSPLYKELRERNSLCYWVQVGPAKVADGSIMMVSTSVKEENIARISELTSAVLSEPFRHMTEERFNLMMNNMRLAKQVADQDFSKSSYREFLKSNDREVSFHKNIDSITYNSTLDFYNQYVNPQVVQWDHLDERSIKEMV